MADNGIGEELLVNQNKMIKEVKYIGFYDLSDSKYKRVSNLAATSKMDYISEAMVEAGFRVHFISPSWLYDFNNGINTKHLKQNTVNISDYKKVTFCPSFSTTTRVGRYIKIVLSLTWLFFYLLKNTRKDEKILLYHVQWLSLPVRWAKKLKRFHLILEVEEIYGDVSAIHPYFNTLEKKLIKSADTYLFSTDLLKNRIGGNKPYLVIYGSYKIYPQLSKPINDGKIHLLYAGIIDTHKAGVFNAVNAAKYLSNDYVLHIIGFGKIELLKDEIEKANKRNDGCNILYDGVLSGDEYVRYCQKCHIGLSTQNMEGVYLESSFPSKILSYLGMGLNVVSGAIDCVIQSKIGHIVNYYTESTPKRISEAIKNTKIGNSHENIGTINKLNIEFVEDIKKILK